MTQMQLVWLYYDILLPRAIVYIYSSAFGPYNVIATYNKNKVGLGQNLVYKPIPQRKYDKINAINVPNVPRDQLP